MGKEYPSIQFLSKKHFPHYVANSFENVLTLGGVLPGRIKYQSLSISPRPHLHPKSDHIPLEGRHSEIGMHELPSRAKMKPSKQKQPRTQLSVHPSCLSKPHVAGHADPHGVYCIFSPHFMRVPILLHFPSTHISSFSHRLISHGSIGVQ